jgi:fatty acid desaturase
MNEKITNKTILQVSLVAGVVTLASFGVAGWGWLILALLLTL